MQGCFVCVIMKGILIRRPLPLPNERELPELLLPTKEAEIARQRPDVISRGDLSAVTGVASKGGVGFRNFFDSSSKKKKEFERDTGSVCCLFYARLFSCTTNLHI